MRSTLEPYDLGQEQRCRRLVASFNRMAKEGVSSLESTKPAKTVDVAFC